MPQRLHSPTDDFVPLNIAASSPETLVVKKDSPWMTLEDLLAEIKKNPKKLTCSVPAFGSTPHFAAELLKIETAFDFTCVPMGGSAEAIKALLGGHVNLNIAEVGALIKHLEAGSLRALTVMSGKRYKDISNVPTTAEKGLPKLLATAWWGFGVRSGTPKAIVEKLEKVFKEALTDKELIEKFEKMGFSVENLNSKESTDFLANDHKIKSEIAKKANIVVK